MQANGEIVLEVKDATRRFGDRLALSGVTFTVRSGETFALIGANGAGKTTLIKAISGRLSLNSGTIEMLGHNIRNDPVAKRLFGLVPQAVALYPHLTARENLEVLGRLSGVSSVDLANAVDEALAWMSLEDRAHERTSNLSGGMQRRLNIAAGTLHRPRLLLLDEPTVGIDLWARESIHELLRKLRRAGLATLLTTHDLDQASELADRVGILADGRLLAKGAPGDLVRDIFGESKELIVTLNQDPETRGRSLLERFCLRPAKGGRTWTGDLQGGFDHVSEIGDQLAEAGLVVDEMRVREPGLRGVFFRVAGRELEP